MAEKLTAPSKQLSCEEQDFLEKYRCLDTHGKRLVGVVLEEALSRVNPMPIDDETPYRAKRKNGNCHKSLSLHEPVG